MSRRQRELEVRAVSGSVTLEERTIAGLGAPIGVEAELIGGFHESFMPGAFDASVRSIQEGRSVGSYFNHDRSWMLGSTGAETLSLEVRSDGLYYTVKPAKTRIAEDVLELVRSREVRGSSVGFIAKKDRFIIDPDGEIHRQIVEARLEDVGPVSEPAYPTTTAEARSLTLVEGFVAKDFEPCRLALRAAGLTDSEIDGRVKAAKDRFEIPSKGDRSVRDLWLRHRQLEIIGRGMAA